MKAMNTHEEEKGEFKVKLPRVLHREESLTEVTYLSAFCHFWKASSWYMGLEAMLYVVS